MCGSGFESAGSSQRSHPLDYGLSPPGCGMFFSLVISTIYKSSICEYIGRVIAVYIHQTNVTGETQFLTNNFFTDKESVTSFFDWDICSIFLIYLSHYNIFLENDRIIARFFDYLFNDVRYSPIYQL